MEEKGKKKGLLVVVILFVLIIIGLAFYILIDKSIINLGSNKAKDKKDEKIVEFDESILKNYYVTEFDLGHFVGPEDGVKVSLGKAYDACDCKFDDEKYEYVCTYDTSKCTENNDAKNESIYYLYDEVNKIYHDKFYTKNDVEKEGFNIGIPTFEWDEKGNRFLRYPVRNGAYSNDFDTYKLKNVTYNGDEAKVEVYRIYYHLDYETDLYYLILNDFSSVKVDAESIDEKVISDIIDKYSSKLPIDILTFKYDNNKYKMKEANIFKVEGSLKVCGNYTSFTKYTFTESDISDFKKLIKEVALYDYAYVMDVEAGREYTYNGYLIPVEVTYDVTEGDKNEIFYFAKKDGVWIRETHGSSFTKEDLDIIIENIESEKCK